VTAAIRRMDIFAFSSLINLGRVQTVGDDSQKCSARSKFSYETLGLRWRSAFVTHGQKFTPRPTTRSFN